MRTRQSPAPLGRRVGHRTGSLGGREEVSCQVVYRVAAETNNNTLKKPADWLSGLASVNSTVDLSKQIFFQVFLFFSFRQKISSVMVPLSFFKQIAAIEIALIIRLY